MVGPFSRLGATASHNQFGLGLTVLRHCPRAVSDGEHHARAKAHRRDEIAGATVVQPFIDHQARNGRAGRRLRHQLESGGIVDRRTVGILMQRRPAMVADRQARVACFNDVAIAAKRFRMRRQAHVVHNSGKANADKGFHVSDFHTKGPRMQRAALYPRERAGLFPASCPTGMLNPNTVEL
jgi:hypothetical protein